MGKKNIERNEVMNKYSIAFKYLDFNSKGRKYIYADSEEEALDIFNKEYKNYNVEIINIKIIGK